MLVINLWGGPGAGKTALAAEVFSHLRRNVPANIEMTGEFATEICFEQAKSNLQDPVYLLGNQWHRLWRLSQIGVEVAISDSPLGLVFAYLKEDYAQRKSYKALVEDLMCVYPSVDIFIHRDIYAEGGFKGNKKGRNNGWLRNLDKRIMSLSDYEFSVTFGCDNEMAITEYVEEQVKAHLKKS